MAEQDVIPDPTGCRDRRSLWQGGLLLIAGLLLIYWPALAGLPLWDDEAHMTKASLRSWQGLWRIWTEPGASQQYYPLLHSFFWIQWRLWGEQPLGHHLVNLAFHAANVWWFWSILRRLKWPGAWLAAALFASHPVMVESVAWISELKNVSSGFFALASFRCLLEFDPAWSDRAVAADAPRRWRWYVAALGLFLLALLCKTVVAMMPLALLLVAWWVTGRMDWRRRLPVMLPFLLIGAAMGLMTAWVERHFIGAQGQAFALSLADRFWLAGRVPWFYLGKLFWPGELLFVYPRWNLSPPDLSGWLGLSATAVFLIAAWRWARSGAPSAARRSLLAGMLIFLSMLFPVLGFLNVYPFRFSFVADHFQYLASLSWLTLIAGALTVGSGRIGGLARRLKPLGAALLLGTLGLLTWHQTHAYRGPMQLWEFVMARHGESGMVLSNYGVLLQEQGRSDQALAAFEKAVRLDPQSDVAWLNLAGQQMLRDWDDQAAQSIAKALTLNPTHVNTQLTAANLWARRGRYAASLPHYRNALTLAMAQWAHEHGRALPAARAKQIVQSPNAAAHAGYGLALLETGDVAQAAVHLRRAVEIQPDLTGVQANLGRALLALGQSGDAVAELEKVAERQPALVEAQINLAWAYLGVKRVGDALAAAQRAVALEPGSALARYALGSALLAHRRHDEAAEQFRACVKQDPKNIAAWNNLGTLQLLAGRADQAVQAYESALAAAQASASGLPGGLRFNYAQALGQLGRLDQAAAQYRQVIAQEPKRAEAHWFLGQILQQQGQLPEAIAAYRQALGLAQASGDSDLAAQAAARLSQLQSSGGR